MCLTCTKIHLRFSNLEEATLLQRPYLPHIQPHNLLKPVARLG